MSYRKLGDLGIRKSGFVFCFVIGFLMLGLSANADSLWNKSSSSPYSPEKAYKLGDVITIIIAENTTAQQKAGTNTSNRDDFDIKLTHSIQRLNPLIGSSNEIDLSGGNKYSGTGTTQRASNVATKIACLVTEVMDNGNIRIEGHHKLLVNDENQDIQVSGVVRSKDISVANTIYSYQVANADISIKGTGVVQEAEAPGWISRILNWIF